MLKTIERCVYCFRVLDGDVNSNGDNDVAGSDTIILSDSRNSDGVKSCTVKGVVSFLSERSFVLRWRRHSRMQTAFLRVLREERKQITFTAARHNLFLSLRTLSIEYTFISTAHPHELQISYLKKCMLFPNLWKTTPVCKRVRNDPSKQKMWTGKRRK